MDIDTIKEEIKARRRGFNFEKTKEIIKDNPKLVKFISKILILAVLFLGSLIFVKTSSINKQLFYDALFKENISFAVINKMYNQYLGDILPFKDIVKDNKPVFEEKLTFTESNIYKDGVSLAVVNSYLVPSLESGIIVFIGEKEGYGKTVIIQQTNGVDVWYGNITNVSVKMYDYIEGGSLIGETVDDKLYLVFKKEGKVVDYKEYLE